MRAAIVAHLDRGSEGLDEQVMRAVERLKPGGVLRRDLDHCLAAEGWADATAGRFDSPHALQYDEHNIATAIFAAFPII